MTDLLEQARQIAATAEVSTPADSLLLYSISYLPSDENKRHAMQYKAEHPQSMMLDDTPCGRQLMALGLETGSGVPDAERLKIWATASRRFILAASGKVTAFVEKADPRSTFVSVELPLLLQNPRITHINDVDKVLFARQWEK